MLGIFKPRDSAINSPDSMPTPQTKQMIQALWRLQKIILDSLDFNRVAETVVNGLLNELGYLKLGYRIIVLTLIDADKQVLQRISLSQTDEAGRAMSLSPIAFHDIEIPLGETENLLVKCVNEKKPQITHEWYDILRPALSPKEAHDSQEASGIKASMVYPVMVGEKAIGALIFSLVKEEQRVSEEEKELIRGFTEIVGLAVQNARLYSILNKTSAELSIANERLKELDKKKDEFVSVASHELRTPMTAIRSYLWLALAGKGGELNEKQKYYLDRSYGSTVRLIKLVNDMLNVSRIESGRLLLQMGKAEVKDLVESVIAEVKPHADESGIKIITRFTDGQGVPPVLADVDKIKEVLLNLVGNSLKFTPVGGSVTVDSDCAGGMVNIHVTDTGEGIPEEDLPKLFQKFGLVSGSYATNQKISQGTGLGLYISKSLVEMQGGKIWVESAGKGRGATFSFSLKQFSEQELEKFRKLYEGKEGLGIIHSNID